MYTSSGHEYPGPDWLVLKGMTASFTMRRTYTPAGAVVVALQVKRSIVKCPDWGTMLPVDQGFGNGMLSRGRSSTGLKRPRRPTIGVMLVS